MKKSIILLLLCVLALIYVYNNSNTNEVVIPEEAIRFRVIANSNTIYDQNIKVQVKNVVQNKIFELINGKDTIDETREVIINNIDQIDSLVSETLQNLEYDKDYNVNYGYNYFPKKEYKGIEYEEGEYESLVISLGDANGDNWWCVLFPPLCLMEVEESDVTDAEYTFFVKELIDKYIK